MTHQLETTKETPQIIPSLLESSQQHIRRIGLFADFKGVRFTSKEHQQVFIKRNLRAAKALAPYSDEKIIDTLIWLKENANFKIALETVGKYIDEDLNQLSNKQSNIIAG